MDKESIQNIISRLSWQGFAIKGFSLLVVVTASSLLSGLSLALSGALTFGFWSLDAMFLKFERRFRFFGVDKKNRIGCNFWSCFFSKTLALFYLMELAFLCLMILENSTTL